MIVFRLTLKRLFGSKVRLGLMFIGPLLFISMFVLSMNSQFSIGIVDEDASYMSKALSKELAQRYKVSMINEENIASRIAEYQDQYIIKIPVGFEASLNQPLESVVVKGYYQTLSTKNAVVEEDINGIVMRMHTIIRSVDGSSTKAYEIYEAYKAQKFDIIDSVGASGVTERFVSSMGFLIQFLLYMAIATTGLLIEDRHSGTYFRNFYAPIKLRRYLFESLLAFMFVGFLQVTLVFAFNLGTMNFSGTEFDGMFFLKVYAIILLFSVVAIALGMFVVNVFKTPTAAYSFMGFITTPLVMLGGCYWDKSFMPEILQTIGRFLPTTWAMEGIHIVISSGTTSQLLEVVGVLLLFITCFFALGLIKKVDVANS